MMKKLFFLAVACCLLAACGKKMPQHTPTKAISTQHNLPGDSAIYGLACDGSTDSILILLPYSGGDLDTFDIINAFQQHRLMGRPHIGDKLAVVLATDSTREVSMVINVSTLQGQWAYLAKPTLRHKDAKMPPLPDSILQRIMTPREYGIRLKNSNMAYSFGAVRNQQQDKMSPVEYPSLKRYARWHLFNGRLVLTPDSVNLSKGQQPDTADVVMLRRDSLVLRFSDHEQAYYRKK